MLFLSACATGQMGSYKDASANTVMITNPEGNSGGTGIVLKSTDHGSLVLTNAHVCGVVVDGGMVKSKNARLVVNAYKKSSEYDLCLIKVQGNLGGGVKIANRPPTPYYEDATVSGHPALYPNVKTYGHFSGREVISILVGFKQCTKEDAEDPNKAFLCIFIGGLPIIKRYESVLVTATIMPGSSGSAVYNEDMELSGVVFAGSGQLGYAWTVPYEFMKDFLANEIKNISYTKPSNVVDIFNESTKNERSFQRLQAVCASENKNKVKNLCELANSDLIFRK